MNKYEDYVCKYWNTHIRRKENNVRERTRVDLAALSCYGVEDTPEEEI